MPLIYKICPAALWLEAEAAGTFAGAPVDLADGFIHFSTATQAAETAARHFAGVANLVLVGVRAEALGPALRWEPSRGGALFPHLYGPLPLSAVEFAAPLPLGTDGRHLFPAERMADEADGPAAADPAALGWVRVRSDRFIQIVGPLWARPPSEPVVAGSRRYGFLAEERHLNNNGAVHGGMIMTFVDHAIGLTARSVNATNRQATVQLDTHFLSGVAEGEFVEASCRLVRQTKTILFLGADLSVGDRPVATALGVWKLGAPLTRPLPPDVSDASS